MIWKILIPLAMIVILFLLLKPRNKGGKDNAVANEQKAVDMKQDPICKTYVEDSTDYKVKYYDDIYYFCSDDCKQKFIKSKSKE